MESRALSARKYRTSARLLAPSAWRTATSRCLRFGPDEKQVRDVRARHEENEADRREQNPQRVGDAADDELLQGKRGGDHSSLVR